MGSGVCFCGGLFPVNLTKPELCSPELFSRYSSGTVSVNQKRNVTEVRKLEVQPQAGVSVGPGTVAELLTWLASGSSQVSSVPPLSFPLPTPSFRFSESYLGLCGEGRLLSCMSCTACRMEVRREMRVSVLVKSVLFSQLPACFCSPPLHTCISFCTTCPPY